MTDLGNLARIDPREVSEPEQGRDRELDGRRQKSGERPEPRVREPDCQAHERNARQRTFDHVSTPDEHDLVERPGRKDRCDHHDAKGRRCKQTRSGQRRAHERR